MPPTLNQAYLWVLLAKIHSTTTMLMTQAAVMRTSRVTVDVGVPMMSIQGRCVRTCVPAPMPRP